MNALQLRLARTALSLSVREAAVLTGTSHQTITRLEAGADLKDSTVAKIRTALEAAGIIFVEENGEGPGVRLRKAKRADDHPKPSGPATDAIDRMDAEIAVDKERKRKPGS